MKQIITIFLIFISYSALTQSESDMKKYYAVIDYIVNNELLIKKSDSYFKKYKSNNLYLSPNNNYLFSGHEMCYKIYIFKFNYITKEEFNSDFDKYCKPIWEEYLLKDSIEGRYLSDSLYKDLSKYLEKHLKRKSNDKLKWEFSISTIFYNCITVDITKKNDMFGASLSIEFFFENNDNIKEISIKVFYA